MRAWLSAAAVVVLLAGTGAASAQGTQTVGHPTAPDTGSDSPEPAAATQTVDRSTPPDTGPAPSGRRSAHGWLDTAQQDLYGGVWRSAMHLDRLFGSHAPASEYQQAYGSIAPELLWDQFHGMQAHVRFRVNVPLPQLNRKFAAFIGRVNPEEYVTEREQPSGIIRRQFGPVEEDQTLFGISYREPEKQGGRFDGGAGVRLRFPLDPYVKGGYVYEHGHPEHLQFGLRETLFWENSEGLGETSRVDVQRIYRARWLFRWATSGTLSQKSTGLRGYTAFDVVRGFLSRRAIAVEVSLDGATQAPVPVSDYGVKIAYRQSILRKWLILEVRTSLDWPKTEPQQHRSPSWGVGMAVELLFGTDTFLAWPVTF